MALAIDSSTPALTQISSSATTTSSFSPPAGSVIFAFFSMWGTNSSAHSVASVTDSLGSHLSWSLYTGSRDNIFSANNMTGTTEVWWAYCPTAQTGMTVTATYSAAANNIASSSNAGIIQTVVFTGASPVQGTAASIRNSTTNATPSQSLTITKDNSWVFGAIQDYSGSTTPTIPTGQSDVVNGHNTFKNDSLGPNYFNSYWVQRQNSITAVAGTAVTINDTAPTNIQQHFSMVEVLPYVAPTGTAPSIVTTTAVTAVAPTAATATGTVENDGDSTITERGVCWGTSANPDTTGNKVIATGTIGSFSANITGLTDATLYHVRTYAINSIGTTYGNDVTFENYPAGSLTYLHG